MIFSFLYWLTILSHIHTTALTIFQTLKPSIPECVDESTICFIIQTILFVLACTYKCSHNNPFIDDVDCRWIAWRTPNPIKLSKVSMTYSFKKTQIVGMFYNYLYCVYYDKLHVITWYTAVDGFLLILLSSFMFEYFFLNSNQWLYIITYICKLLCRTKCFYINAKLSKWWGEWNYVIYVSVYLNQVLLKWTGIWINWFPI